MRYGKAIEPEVVEPFAHIYDVYPRDELPTIVPKRIIGKKEFEEEFPHYPKRYCDSYQDEKPVFRLDGFIYLILGVLVLAIGLVLPFVLPMFKLG